MEIGEVMSANQPTGAKKKSVPKKVDWKALEVVHPDAAGIDVGGSEHWVAVSLCSRSWNSRAWRSIW
jgi:hypothetical protein